MLATGTEASRPFIPAGLDKVEARAGGNQTFLGTRPEPIAKPLAPKKGPSLFERLTGRTKPDAPVHAGSVVPRDAVQPAPAAQAQPMHAEPAPQPQVQSQPQSQPQPQPQPQPQSQPAARHEPTSSPAPQAAPARDEGLVASSFEEDQLEIPTFLRRQAN